MKILVTGTAGFIGHHLALRLAARGDEVLGLDNINDYYDVELKYGRLQEQGFTVDAGAPSGTIHTSSTHPNLRFVRMDIENAEALKQLFAEQGFDRVCHLAAQAGVRYSLVNPSAYTTTNVQGFLNILEAVRAYPVEHLCYASSSSVYGIDSHMPFRETTSADHPASLYAVSKRANELMAHSYSHLYGIPTTGLRFFTVYGPWGRPDMALYLFTQAILEGRAIDVYNHGEMKRDFTYVDDIVEGIVRVIDRPAKGATDWDGTTGGVSPAPYRVYNIGNGAPVLLMDFISALGEELGVEVKKNMMPIQPGDVPATWADCSALERETGYRPDTPIRSGIREFVRWYRGFYGN